MDSKRTALWWGLILFIFIALSCSKAPLPTQNTEENIEKQNNVGKIIVTAIDLNGEPIDSAEVYWDGQFIGLTPLEKNDATIGTHTVRVQKTGYEIYSEFVSILSNETSYIEAILKKLALNKGQLFITVNPDSVLTTVTNANNEVVVSFYDQVRSIVLDPGGYFIKAERPGYRIYYVAVEIRIDSVVIQNIQLEKIENTTLPQIALAVPDSGQINVPVLISWESNNAERVDIDYISNPGLSGKREIVFQLPGMKYIRATAYNNAGSTSVLDSIYISNPVEDPKSPPTIEVSVEPASIFAGQSTTICWNSENASTVSVDFVPGAGLDGAWQVKFDVPGTYPIDAYAYGTGGEAHAVDTLYVLPNDLPDLPVIEMFEVDPDSIQKGDFAVLQWKVSGENVRVIIDQGIGEMPPQGTANISPEVTTQYTLYATNAGGTVSKKVVLIVAEEPSPPAEPPTISITAEPQDVMINEPVTLSWSSENANMVMIDFVPQAGLSGQYQLTFSQPGEFVIKATAYGDGGSAQDQVVVTVHDFDAPTLNFSATPDNVNFGEPVYLAWETNGYQVIIDQGVGVRGPVGTEEVYFESPGYKIFTATAYGEGEKTTIKKDTVFVHEPEPPAMPTVWLAIVDSVEVGSPALVEWHSQNAERVDVDYVQNPGLNGRAEITFSSPGMRVISATAYNSAGSTTVSDTIVVVETNITQQMLPIYVSSMATVAAIHPTIPQVQENAGQTLITRAGYYRITAVVWYNSGDIQKNESFYIVLHDANGNNIYPEDPNAGIYKVVPDDPGDVHVSERNAGLFYLNPGQITISLYHYYTIAQQFPQFIVDGPINGPESVHVISFKLEYWQP